MAKPDPKPAAPPPADPKPTVAMPPASFDPTAFSMALLTELHSRPGAPTFLLDGPTLRLTYADAETLAPRCSADDEMIRAFAPVLSATQTDERPSGHVVTYTLAL